MAAVLDIYKRLSTDVLFRVCISKLKSSSQLSNLWGYNKICISDTYIYKICLQLIIKTGNRIKSYCMKFIYCRNIIPMYITPCNKFSKNSIDTICIRSTFYFLFGYYVILKLCLVYTTMKTIMRLVVIL